MLEVKRLNSLSEILQVIPTNGNRPVKIIAKDFAFYYCKHNFGKSCHTLLYEYISSTYLNIWKIKTPEVAFIDILPEHFENCVGMNLQPRFFKNTCFASKELKEAVEIDNFMKNMSAKKIAQFKKREILQIALFDIWIANEDRKWDNPNLLIQPHHNSLHFYAIDHGSTFNNGSSFPNGNSLVQITEDETILAHNLIRRIFRNYPNNIEKYNELRNEICSNFRIFVKQCKSETNLILENIPSNWDIDVGKFKDFLFSNLFNEKWIQESENNFKYFIDLLLIQRQ